MSAEMVKDLQSLKQAYDQFQKYPKNTRNRDKYYWAFADMRYSFSQKYKIPYAKLTSMLVA